MDSEFARRGCFKPVRVMPGDAARRLGALLRAEQERVKPEWSKGLAAASRAFFEIGCHPVILDHVRKILGNDIILWGASIQSRVPGAVHPWHSDMETCAPDARAVSVWLGLEGTTRESSLLAIPGSHLYGPTIQEVRKEHGKARNDTTANDVLTWARERDATAVLDQPEVTDGEALIFDGRLWHGSDNRSQAPRHALLLQFAAADMAIRIPDLTQLDWPFRFLESPLPPCVLVSGNASDSHNRIVPPPYANGFAERPPLTPAVFHASPAPDPDTRPEANGWSYRHLFGGCTPNADVFAAHVSTLLPGMTPHPPQGHEEEEIKLMLDGEASLTLPEVSGKHVVRSGEFVHFPYWLTHTLTSLSSKPIHYVVIKWRGTGPKPKEACLPFGKFSANATAESSEPFATRLACEGPTVFLRKLHVHTTTLAPGAGYPPHADAHDVLFVVMEGTVETMGLRASATDLILCPAGFAHGMHNPGDKPARYLVIELHGRQDTATGAALAPQRTPSLWDRIIGLIRSI